MVLSFLLVGKKRNLIDSSRSRGSVVVEWSKPSALNKVLEKLMESFSKETKFWH